MNKTFQTIGVCGLNASGKSSLCSFYKAKGYQVISLSDVIRRVLKERNQPESRQLLIDTGNELRHKHGSGALAKMIIPTLDINKNYVIDSIRHPEEVRELRNGISLRNGLFCLVAVKASTQIRYNRLVSRAREGDVLSYDRFLETDKLESNNPDPQGQQIASVIAMADITVDNDYQDIQKFNNIITTETSIKIDHFLGDTKQLEE
ncbi:hypothetical protein DFA_06242 [Cavenderia fasciculata]|uniref:Dephospho-CoA kinase n=1 Tax=Cavenderia fasciculata TaxID=261658 RepID=F4PKH9_CACFS|nr:uncharacterized protein DFA_06242 [Cavenderia fasciculata]EGG24103.1 hypothetical protein DFA_06242 [Cavenderia fasciculata]|eukprot:XP_004361954.1 hypothetical protein DFA_06242 [Cavenderia fasciculata]